MGIDVIHILGREVSVPQSTADSERLTLWRWSGVIVGIKGPSRSSHPGKDGSPSAKGMSLRLQNKHRRTLSQHEAISLSIERTRGATRLVIPAGERPQLPQEGDAQGRDDGLRPPRQHHIGVPLAKVHQGHTDSVVTTGTCAVQGRIRALETEEGPDLAGRHVRPITGDKEGVKPTRTLLPQPDGLIGCVEEPSHRSQHHARTGIVSSVDHHIGHRQCLFRRHDGKLSRPPHPPGLLKAHVVPRVKLLDFGRDLDRQISGVEARDQAYTGTPNL